MCLFYSDPISGWPPTAVRTATSAPVSDADPGYALRSFPGDLSMHHNDLRQLVLRFACRLRHPPERVWHAIEDARAGTLADPWREPPAAFATLNVRPRDVAQHSEADDIDL